MIKFCSLVPVLAVCLTGAIFTAPSSAQTYRELIGFDGNSAAGPTSPLTQGVDGALYGVTMYGGTGTCFDGKGIGCGVVFKVTPGGRLSILYNFQGDQNGYYPQNSLALGLNGDLYGTTYGGNGTIFKVTPNGTLTTLHIFQGADGSGLFGGLTLGTDGNFYGTTNAGGAHSSFCPSGCGTIYKMTPSGTVKTLYSFCQQNYCPDGNSPRGRLAEGTDGNFYGTAWGGGLYKLGTIFRITPTGSFTLLYTVQNSNYPQLYGGLMLATDGNFYGSEGGTGLYQITPQGAFTQLPNPGNEANLPIEGNDGNLYGTTVFGGTLAFGNLFQMPLNGFPLSLYSFAGYPSDGSLPYTSLVQHTNGTFYGTTWTGGSSPCNYDRPGCGTIFSVDMGLYPLVALLRSGGRAGTHFGVLGQGLTGTTSVLLNGAPASFTFKADSFLIVTVPVGATTGYVTVTTPSGTLTSNVPFQVIF